MNYCGLNTCDVTNGPGCRVSLFVSGCEHRCKGCHNPETWNPDYGKPYTKEIQDKILKELNKSYINGLSISGGDPLFENNLASINELCALVKMYYPDKTIWLWTGYNFDTIKSKPEFDNIDVFLNEIYRAQILSNIDVLIDGKFKLNKRDITLPYCGSTNQRVIDVQKTLEAGHIVRYSQD